MCYPLQLSLSVHVSLSRPFLFQLHHTFVYKSVFSFLVVVALVRVLNNILFQNTTSNTVIQPVKYLWTISIPVKYLWTITIPVDTDVLVGIVV